jgi:hypothetical protein
MSKRTAVAVGQFVRARRNNYHYAKFGAVGRVEWVGIWDVQVRFPAGAVSDEIYKAGGSTETQYIEQADILPAKQANKKVQA